MPIKTLAEVSAQPTRFPHRWLSISDAATYTGLCEKTIRRLIEVGKIIGRRPVRGRILISHEELDNYILGCVDQ